MDTPFLDLSPREMKEVHFALLYARDFHHGTAGHNSYIVLARLADHLGFFLDPGGTEMEMPDVARIIEETKRAPTGL